MLTPAELNQISMTTVIDWDIVNEEMRKDAKLTEIVNKLKKDELGKLGWNLENGLLYY